MSGMAPAAAPGALTAAFQAALAGMVTNRRIARACFDGEARSGLPSLSPGEQAALGELGRSAGPRVMILADLLSQRRFRRAAQLLPASRQLLGPAFDAAWEPYLEAGEPGMPSATAEAVGFARFLRCRGAGGSGAGDVLRYEEALNEASRRLIARPAPAPVPSAPPADEDLLRLSDFALVECFEGDVIARVKALRDGGDAAAPGGGARIVLFRPKHDEGVAVDVAVLPEPLGACLGRASSAAPLAALLEITTPELRPALRAKLHYLVKIGVLAVVPASRPAAA